jgi:FkbM family methyltransferase
MSRAPSLSTNSSGRAITRRDHGYSTSRLPRTGLFSGSGVTPGALMPGLGAASPGVYSRARPGRQNGNSVGVVTMKETLRTLRWWLIYQGPRRDVTVDTANGLLTFDSKDRFIGKCLYVKRSHEMHEIRAVVELLQKEGRLDATAPAGTVLNVGANIGMTCIGLMKVGGFARAIAFEPAPDNYRLLARNIAQNGLQGRIRPFPLALSSVEGELDLELSEDNSGDHRIRRTDDPGFFHEERRQTIKVGARTLDGLMAEIAELRDDRVELVWIDIQGHEGYFFQGARHFLGRNIPVVSELWPYGIGRSGMPRYDFCRTVSGLFTHFYALNDEPPRKRPISEIENAFDRWNRPREFHLVMFVRE